MTQDQELFELCKEVYEKTGWKPTDWQHGDEDGQPLYTSDCLLGKLPKETRFGTPQLIWYVGHWEACYTDAVDSLWNQELKSHAADTPLKALLKLVIALDDAGVKL